MQDIEGVCLLKERKECLPSSKHSSSSPSSSIAFSNANVDHVTNQTKSSGVSYLQFKSSALVYFTHIAALPAFIDVYNNMQLPSYR